MSNNRPRVLPTKRAIEKLYSQIDEEVDRLVASALDSPPSSPPTHRLCIRSDPFAHSIQCNIRAMEAADREEIEIADLRKHAALMHSYQDDDSSSSIPLNQPNQEDIDNALAWISQRSSAGNENDGYLPTQIASPATFQPLEGVRAIASPVLAQWEAQWEYIAHMEELNENERPIRYVDRERNREQRLYRRDEIVPAGNRGWLLPARVNLDEDESYSDSSATIPL